MGRTNLDDYRLERQFMQSTHNAIEHLTLPYMMTPENFDQEPLLRALYDRLSAKRLQFYLTTTKSGSSSDPVYHVYSNGVNKVVITKAPNGQANDSFYPFVTITPNTIDKERTYGPIKVNPTELLDAVQALVEGLPC